MIARILVIDLSLQQALVDQHFFYQRTIQEPYNF